jgi:hypothetical protein
MMMRLLYALLVGIPASLFLMTIGCLLCLTVIGFPAGLVWFGLGVKVLTIDSPRRTVVVVRRESQESRRARVGTWGRRGGLAACLPTCSAFGGFW